MSLRQKFLAQNLLLAFGLCAVAAVSFWRLGTLRREVEASRFAFTELKTAQTMMVQTAEAKGLLAAGPGVDRQRVAATLREAVGGLDDFVDTDGHYTNDPEAAAAYVDLTRTARRARERLVAVLEAVEPRGGTAAGALPPVPDNGTLASTVDAALWDMEALVRGCTAYIRTKQDEASAKLTRAALLIGGLCTVAVLAALLVTASQYRSVMAPLHRLRRGVRGVAAARFSERLDAAGSREFSELSEEFNRMAAELEGFYRQLEEKVRAKSRELVRSERLASVGFLAAGVAHEINNPLNIITGYAELTLKKLRALDDDPAAPDDARDAARDAARSLQIIRDEAFRCKETTEKLLSLARGGKDVREPLNLASMAAEVAAMTRGLKNYRDRKVAINFRDDADAMQVVANASEMKQVLLNLTVNALEAVAPGSGEVVIDGRRDEEWVEVSVSDNGRGIAPESLPHVFEPFFTDKRGAGEPGTGLGLSITHAIVEGHGGRIEAYSAGCGRGSRFTFRLPAASGSLPDRLQEARA
jgi:signal transduction histidine kinase